jgi:hypothetical protein
MRLDAVPLENRFVRLEPLAPMLEDEVRAALDCDPASWDIMVAAACGPYFDDWWHAALRAMAQGTRIAWAAPDSSSARRCALSSVLPSDLSSLRAPPWKPAIT